MDYFFDYLAYDSSLFSDAEQQNLAKGNSFTYEQLIQAAEEPFRRVNTGSAGPKRMFGTSAFSTQQSSLFREMFLQDYDSFIDIENKKANLTDGKFIKLLESLKKYNDNGYLQVNSDSSEPVRNNNRRF